MNDQGSSKGQESEISIMKLKDPMNLNGQSNINEKTRPEHSVSNHDTEEDRANGHEIDPAITFSTTLSDMERKENMSFQNIKTEDLFPKNGFNVHKVNAEKVEGMNIDSKDINKETLEKRSNDVLNSSKDDSDFCEIIVSKSEVLDSIKIKAEVGPQSNLQSGLEKDDNNEIIDKENDSDVIIIGSSDSCGKSQTPASDDASKKQVKSQSNGSKPNTEGSTNSTSGDSSITSFARLLHDLGVELVRQHVYKDLIEIQMSKDSQNKLSDREKEQLTKLEEFYSKQEVRNAPYSLKPYVTRCKCRVFATDSINVMQLHQEYGRIEGGTNHVCCCCREFKTRWPSHFIAHMKSDHGMTGRLRKKMSPYKCSFCSYEAKNQLKIDTHMVTCSKRFVLACNLQPLPADADIPLKRKFIQHGSYSSNQQRYSNYLTNVASNYSSNYHINNQGYYTQSSVMPRSNESLQANMSRNMYSNMQHSTSTVGNNGSSLIKDGRTAAKHSSTVELCEICGVSMGNRAVLLNHLQIQHKVKLNTTRGSTEPTMSCDRCPSRFWTYQGLAKHATVVHRINTGSSSSLSAASILHGTSSRTPPACHICGESQTLNPLNHMSTRHNITLLDMFYAKQCYICNKSLKNGPAFQDHMVLYHRDIFANKDVLHTVLQALSAARHLKREESLQHHPASSNLSRYKKPIAGQPLNVTQSNMAGRVSTNRKRSSQQLATQPTKLPEKKSQEQDRAELEKLYENLAGIGRPILRSMRHKMSSGSLPVTPSSKTTTQHSGSLPSIEVNKPLDNDERTSAEATKDEKDQSSEPAPKKMKFDDKNNLLSQS